jgi:AbrB family looped-hinge helix DNA binding protein
MGLARSRITAQGQISVPVSVRRKLGVGPGSTLEWIEEGNRIVVRRAGHFTSEDIHQAVFGGSTPAPHSIDSLKEGIRHNIEHRHARD